MVTADHGPAVSGAHNTIVCARAGKDLVSSLVSGLLTIVSSIMFIVQLILLSLQRGLERFWCLQCGNNLVCLLVFFFFFFFSDAFSNTT